MRKFEKVSKEQYLTGFYDAILDMCEFDENDNPEFIKDYHDIKLPKRATKGSAGYDCFAPFDITLEPGEDIKVPTGIKCFMENDDVLLAFPRSGLGFKFYCRIANTIGVIDSDYILSDNEGHIFIKLRNEGNKTMNISKGTGMCQFIFTKFLLTDDDSFDNGEIRNGGFGSTSTGN